VRQADVKRTGVADCCRAGKRTGPDAEFFWDSETHGCASFHFSRPFIMILVTLPSFSSSSSFRCVVFLSRSIILAILTGSGHGVFSNSRQDFLANGFVVGLATFIHHFLSIGNYLLDCLLGSGLFFIHCLGSNGYLPNLIKQAQW
jgi:hypothetical protein